MAAGGLVVKAQDGTTYFIRDEILEACKVADDELAATEAMTEESAGEVGGFSLNFAQPVQIGSQLPNINVKATTVDVGALNEKIKSMSTVMCCW